MAVHPEQLARTLVRRHAEERRRVDVRAESLRSELQRAVREEGRQGRFRRAWLVGSLAWGGFGVGSDVDVVVEGLTEVESAALWDRLSSRLGVRIDLLRLETLPPAFADRVRAEGESLHVS